MFERSHGNGTTTRDFVDPATGAIVESRTYDADGRVTSQTTYDPYTRKRWQIRTIDPVTGNITSIDELHPNGTVAKRTEFQTDGADNGADQRPARTRYYDANGRMYLDEVHHSGTGRVIIRYIYDQNTGKLVRTDYYDLNGTLLFSEQGGAYPQT